MKLPKYRDIRNKRIIRMREKGFTYAYIGHCEGMTGEGVRQVVKKLSPDLLDKKVAR